MGFLFRNKNEGGYTKLRERGSYSEYKSFRELFGEFSKKERDRIKEGMLKLGKGESMRF